MLTVLLSIDHLDLHAQEGVGRLARSAQSRAGLQAIHSGTPIAETRFPDNPFPTLPLDQLCLKEEKIYAMRIDHLEQKCSRKESQSDFIFHLFNSLS